MSKHTPEPWFHHQPSGSHHTAGGYINASQDRDDGYICAVYGSGRPCNVTAANALRIVSCVNACAGMRDPEKSIAKMRKKIKQLDAFAGDRCDRVDDLWSQLCAAEEQRDKLLAALESLSDVASSCDGWESFPRYALDEANQAIMEASK